MEVASEGAGTDAESGVDSKAVSKVRRKARGFLQDMVANISPAFIRYSFHVMKSYIFFKSKTTTDESKCKLSFFKNSNYGATINFITNIILFKILGVVKYFSKVSSMPTEAAFI